MGIDADVPRVLAAVVGVAVVIALAVGGATSTAAFGSFNPDWDGTSDLRSLAESEGAEPVVVRNATRYDDYGDGDVAFVLTPETEYAEADTDHVRQFVEHGGTLVVADRDGPRTAVLLGAVGADARLAGPLLRDEHEYYRGPALPVASEVGNHSLVANVSSLTLNHGTAVEPNGATVLVASSEYSYLDRDESGSPSDDEVLESYPVATVESIGNGSVVVVGDPSVFINVMQDRSDNQAFATAIVADADAVLVDVSHGVRPPPLMSGLLTIRESLTLQLALGVGALVIVRIGSRLVERRPELEADRYGVDEQTLETGLQRLYSSLDSTRLRKVTKGVISSRSQPPEDE